MPIHSCFKWVGAGVAAQRRKPLELHYRSFRNDSLFVCIDDYVLIRNDDSIDPEDIANCYIAQVQDLYDTGNGDEPYKAKVCWYSRISELQQSFLKKFNLLDQSEYEVVEEHRRHWENVVDAESIFGKCVVMFLPVNSDLNSQKFKLVSGTPVFYCRYKFTGVMLLPKVAETKSENQEKGIRTPVSGRRNKLRCSTTPRPTRLLKKEGYEHDLTKVDASGLKLKSLVISVPKVEDFIITNSVEDRKDILSPKKRFKVEMSSSPTRLRIRALDISNTYCKPEITVGKMSHGSAEGKNPVPNTPHKSPMKNSGLKSISRAKQTPRSSPRIRKNMSVVENGMETPTNKEPQTPETTYSTPSRKDRSRRALIFTDIKSNEDDIVTHTTRYGRKVKAVSSLSSMNLLLTPEKTTPNKRPAVRKNTKFYHSDESSDESVYHPDGDSSSDESGIGLPREELSRKRTPTLKKGSSKQSTPSSRKKLRSPVTPSLPQRRQPVKTPSNVLEESRQRLHVSSVPNSLPCRDEEYSDIYAFIESNLINQTGGCMYVSGVPGTGKTATVHEVIRNLEAERDCNSLPTFQFIEVNGMKMTDPYQCYVQIFKALTGQRIAPQQAASMLEKRFTKPGPKHDAIILLVDELDKLWTRKQTVMYNIFDWPTKPGSKLIVIAIANTMDLPERMMMSRVSSRLGLTRKTFQPYTYRELQEIVMSRIQELNVFDPDAVQLVARKVAAVSGDARRALEICRRAAEVAEEGSVVVSPSKKKNILVGMAHVDAALNQMLSSPEVAAIRGCSEFQKIFFKALLAEFERSGNEETTLFKLYRQFLLLCRLEGLPPPTTSQASTICSHLSSSHLILIDNFDNDLFMKIRLNVSVDDVTYALNGYIS